MRARNSSEYAGMHDQLPISDRVATFGRRLLISFGTLGLGSIGAAIPDELAAEAHMSQSIALLETYAQQRPTELDAGAE